MASAGASTCLPNESHNPKHIANAFDHDPDLACLLSRTCAGANNDGDSEKQLSVSETAPTCTDNTKPDSQHLVATESLKYSLLGPSLLKAGQDNVDQSKVSEIIYNASKGSKFFAREEARDRNLTEKIRHIVAKKADLDKQAALPAATCEGDCNSVATSAAYAMLAALEATRDLSQTIVHVDCDAFYASVEQLSQPQRLHDGVAFAVGGGVLTTCNYAARRFGVRSGMPAFVARKLCPQLIVVPLDFAKYNAKAREVRQVLAEYDPNFESASIDEAYLNITEYCARGPRRAAHSDEQQQPAPVDTNPASLPDLTLPLDPETVVQELRVAVHARTGITISAGIAANARLAKICSNRNKPNGHFRLPATREAIASFMQSLPVRQVNGVGRVLERQLAAIGVRACGDLYDARAYLAPLFGRKTAEFLLQVHLGLGRTWLRPARDSDRKSIGTERTFAEMSAPAELRAQLRRIAVALESDLARSGSCKGRTLCLKVKLHTFEVLTRQTPTPRPVCTADDFYRFALPMLTRLEDELKSSGGLKIRLMGL